MDKGWGSPRAPCLARLPFPEIIAVGYWVTHQKVRDFRTNLHRHAATVGPVSWPIPVLPNTKRISLCDTWRLLLLGTFGNESRAVVAPGHQILIRSSPGRVLVPGPVKGNTERESETHPESDPESIAGHRAHVYVDTHTLFHLGAMQLLASFCEVPEHPQENQTEMPPDSSPSSGSNWKCATCYIRSLFWHEMSDLALVVAVFLFSNWIGIALVHILVCYFKPLSADAWELPILCCLRSESAC